MDRSDGLSSAVAVLNLILIALLLLTVVLLAGGGLIGTTDALGESLVTGGMLTLAAALVLLGLKVLRRALRRG